MSSATREAAGSDRRRFLKLVGMAGLTTAVHASLTPWAGAAPAQATRPASPVAPPKSAVSPDSSRAAAATPPEISEEARALAGIVQRRYGRHLSPQQLEAVTRELENRVQGGKRLRDAKLANHDEPDVVFSA